LIASKAFHFASWAVCLSPSLHVDRLLLKTFACMSLALMGLLFCCQFLQKRMSSLDGSKEDNQAHVLMYYMASAR
jgi:hypothetical protein